MTPTRQAVELHDVRFCWRGTANFSIAVEHFAIGEGERVLLLGPSGSGKSTLLALLAGILVPQQGSIAVAGTDIARLPASGRDRFRAEHVGLIFQSLNLMPYLSALDNVVLPLHFAPQRRKRVGGRAAIANAARTLLDGLGLPATRFASISARELSIGQQQRVAVARALIGQPGLVIADEPTSALDADHRKTFLDLLNARLTGTATALLMVSHDRALTPLFDRTVELAAIARIGHAS